jgi:hypothetical protein
MCRRVCWIFNLEIICYSWFIEPYETYPGHGLESLVGFDLLTRPVLAFARIRSLLGHVTEFRYALCRAARLSRLGGLSR